MKKHIETTLKIIAAEQGIKLLYACESGSRAWGFPSPDSDWDVRFIYSHPLDWYLSLQSQKDTINKMLPLELDLSGWELKKALRLFAGSNLALFEWVESPEVYFNDSDFHQRLKALIPLYFNPCKAMHHYLAMARNNIETHLQSNEVQIKKFFYILRPLLACEWIANFKTMPPTEFAQLLAHSTLLTSELRDQVNGLLKEKENAAEGFIVTLSSNMVNWFAHQVSHFEDAVSTQKGSLKVGWEPLNELVNDFLKRE